jgi:hypothetical protein
VLVFEITGTVIEWRGPAPFYFVATPKEVTREIEKHKSALSYGWGVIPASVTIGEVTVTTSLIPRSENFYVPLKEAIRKPNNIFVRDTVDLMLTI